MHGYTVKGKATTEDMPADVETMSELSRCTGRCRAGRSRRREFEDVKELPEAARNYLNFISDGMQVEIGMVSTGPERDATIVPQGTKLAAWL